MEVIINGTRSMAEKFEVTRDTIRWALKKGWIKSKLIRKNNNMVYVFTVANQKKFKKDLAKSKKTG